MSFLRRKSKVAEGPSVVDRVIEIHVEREYISLKSQADHGLASGMEACPLCGHSLDSTKSVVQGALANGHPVAHGSCPGTPERVELELTATSPKLINAKAGSQ